MVAVLKHTLLSPSDLQIIVKGLPDLQRQYPNLAFWSKIEKYMAVGGLCAFHLCTRIRAKCPKTALTSLSKNHKNSAWATTRFEFTQAMGDAAEIFRKAVMQALGMGSNLFTEFSAF